MLYQVLGHVGLLPSELLAADDFDVAFLTAAQSEWNRRQNNSATTNNL